MGLGYNLIGFSRQEKSSVDFVVQWMGYLDNAVHLVSLGVGFLCKVLYLVHPRENCTFLDEF